MSLRETLSDVFHERTNFDFVGPKKKWFAFSAILILIGLAALGLRGLNLGIDFKGGTAWEVKVEGKKPSADGAREAAERGGVIDPGVQILGGDTVRVEARRSTIEAAGEGPRRAGRLRQRPGRATSASTTSAPPGVRR